MTKNHYKIKYQSGFLTLEILIAMTVLILMLAVVVMVSFGNQSMIIDTQTNSEALNIAQGLLETAQADGRKDFNLVNPVLAVTTADSFIYNVNVEQTDYFTKLVKAIVEFPEDSGRRGTTTLSTIVTNFNNAVGGDTCSSVLLPNAEAWKTPQVHEKFSDFSGLGGTDNYPITDIDAYKNKLYVTIGKTNDIATPTFFVFDINGNEVNTIENDFVDNNPSISSGLNAVAVAENPASTSNPKNLYAYVASASVSNQLQVIEVTPTLVKPDVIPTANLKAEHVTGSQGVGNSIFYKDGYVYLGLKATGHDPDTGVSQGPEFHIIDVHKIGLGIASEIGHWPANGNLNNDINAIYVQGRYAYLATPNSKNLIVLDISNASSPVEVGSFDGGNNNGKSLSLVGDTLYLGGTEGGTEFFVLDNSDPKKITINNPSPSSKDIGTSVDGVITRNHLSFLLTKTNFQVWKINQSVTPWNISQWSPSAVPIHASSSTIFEPVLDCEGNNFFVGSNDSGNNGYISIITP